MFAGHFPGNPILPGVYMIEAMAQLGGTIVLEPGDFARKIPYLAGIDKAKFRRPVIPGDRLDMEVRCCGAREHRLGRAEATVDGKFVVLGRADVFDLHRSANVRTRRVDLSIA